MAEALRLAERPGFTDAHHDFRAMIRRLVEEEVAPHYATWEEAGAPPRSFYRRLGELGVLGIEVPERWGGSGVEGMRFSAVLSEEASRRGVVFGALRVHTDIVLPYLLRYADDEQLARIMPGFVSGETMTAIAMTEPDTGSDVAGIRTTARRDGDSYVLNGAKTFITGGAHADLVLVVCRTSPPDPADKRHGLSILLVDTTSPGFSVGRRLKKIGLQAQDTAELHFEDVRVPVENVLGAPDVGFGYLTHNLPKERLSIALGSYAAAAGAIELARDYTAARRVFGTALSDFQNTKFVLAECRTETLAAQTLVDRCLELDEQGRLTAADAAVAKLFCTEVQGRVVDRCLQLHGGYGYVTEYPIARLYADARVTRIYGGTSEVLKTIISKAP
ncbi:acyl-CoA dehydrogenase family protein [Nocardioides sp. QY071]|uniref:acyl-CoA dehydrogenase family protein n=1 Tax=Nocardioides sp. QY071 TaxID=3044187 RepID=UPI00249A3EF5|nr:acyl-CoA dehydrogenase family protein [Nocardioides sp. QY071]WGY00399.1 acyl-CoA dehydrogenase family protein [Nocardioides sp. QY071]